MHGASTSYFRFNKLDPTLEQWQAIARYNAEIRNLLPNGARSFVFSDWHYNYHDPRCPHDSWIKSIDFKFATDDTNVIGIVLHLLGAFHDRHISIEYENVTDLLFNGKLISDAGRNVEWIYDEVHLLPSGRLEHVIEFSQCLVRIEGADFNYRFEMLREPDLR